MMTAGQALAFSIRCSAADTLDSLGRLMLTPIAAYVVIFPIIMVLGGSGRGQMSSFIGTIGLYFGSRTKLVVFGVFCSPARWAAAFSPPRMPGPTGVRYDRRRMIGGGGRESNPPGPDAGPHRF